MTGTSTRGSLSFGKKRKTVTPMKPLKIDRTKLITPREYAKKHGVSPAAVTKMMDTDRVNVVDIIGGRLILED